MDQDLYPHSREMLKITENDIALIENLVRDDLSPIEEAKAYMNRWKLMIKEDKDLKSLVDIPLALSKVLPPSKTRIEQRISLLKLPEPIQNAIDLGTFKKTYEYWYRLKYIFFDKISVCVKSIFFHYISAIFSLQIILFSDSLLNVSSSLSDFIPNSESSNFPNTLIPFRNTFFNCSIQALKFASCFEL